MIFGWSKDKFDPEAIYYFSLKEVQELITLPARVSLARYLPPDAPWDQGNKGHCVGFGIGMNLTMRAIEQKVFSKLNQRFSPEWIVDGAQEMEGTTGQDAGAEPTDAWKWLKKHGCLPEQYDPYTDNVRKDPPDSNLDVYAMEWPLSDYIRAVDGLRGLQTSLAVGNMISIGTPWFQKWVEDVKADGILPDVTPDDEVAGGHETILIGYETISKVLYFRGVNSWGKDWGDHGLYWMPATAIKVFKWMGGYDAQFPKLPWKL